MDREAVRQRYQPAQVRVLLVGEAPPLRGTFFYDANSNLYGYTQLAFSAVYGPQIGAGEDFLRHFQALGCYLEDVCHEPVHQLAPPLRRQAHQAGMRSLAERISIHQPQALIVVMRAIERCVIQAVEQSGVEGIVIHSVPFPAQGNQQRYVQEMVSALVMLKQREILAPSR